MHIASRNFYNGFSHMTNINDVIYELILYIIESR